MHLLASQWLLCHMPKPVESVSLVTSNKYTTCWFSMLKMYWMSRRRRVFIFLIYIIYAFKCNNSFLKLKDFIQIYRMMFGPTRWWPKWKTLKCEGLQFNYFCNYEAIIWCRHEKETGPLCREFTDQRWIPRTHLILYRIMCSLMWCDILSFQ